MHLQKQSIIYLKKQKIKNKKNPSRLIEKVKFFIFIFYLYKKTNYKRKYQISTIKIGVVWAYGSLILQNDL